MSYNLAQLLSSVKLRCFLCSSDVSSIFSSLVPHFSSTLFSSAFLCLLICPLPFFVCFYANSSLPLPSLKMSCLFHDFQLRSFSVFLFCFPPPFSTLDPCSSSSPHPPPSPVCHRAVSDPVFHCLSHPFVFPLHQAESDSHTKGLTISSCSMVIISFFLQLLALLFLSLFTSTSRISSVPLSWISRCLSHLSVRRQWRCTWGQAHLWLCNIKYNHFTPEHLGQGGVVDQGFVRRI